MISFFFTQIFPFLVVLGVVIFVHELGHYWAARISGIAVETFSIGFGPALISWKRKGTQWQIAAIPLGGYVRMRGGLMPWDDEKKEPGSFPSSRIAKRAFTVIAGPAANMIFAAAAFALLFMTIGQPHSSTEITDVIAEGPADHAGLRPGDVLHAINDTQVTRFEDIRRIVARSPNQDISITLERDARLLTIPLTTKSLTTPTGATIGRIGIVASRQEFVRQSPPRALINASKETLRTAGQILSSLWQLFTGQINTKQLSGPVKIAAISAQVAEQGIAPLIAFIALLSINIGLLNLLPLPILDGGLLVILGIEATLRRPPARRWIERSYALGLVLILSLLLLTTWQDIVSLIAAR